MLETDGAFAGSIPENYDRHMVPLIFAPYAVDLAARGAALAPESVLETAAGTGVLTRALAPNLSATARYVVTDLNRPMLDHAAERQGPDPRIAWHEADAMALPFDDASFDLVCCQFGAMLSPDRPAAYREARRVLKPGGRFLFNVWDRIEENDFAYDVTRALAEIFPHDPPRLVARTPHGYHDTDRIRGDLALAGYGDVSIVTRADVSRAASPRIPALAYCQGTVLRTEIETREPGRLASATDHAEAAIAARHGHGEIAAKLQAHVIVAVA